MTHLDIALYLTHVSTEIQIALFYRVSTCTQT